MEENDQQKREASCVRWGAERKLTSRHILPSYCPDLFNLFRYEELFSASFEVKHFVILGNILQISLFNYWPGDRQAGDWSGQY